ncbi:MAG: hypothetical protein RIQ56_279 [Candidatus Parcubacteria bacterium]|jgi:hypothetical protein
MPNLIRALNPDTNDGFTEEEVVPEMVDLTEHNQRMMVGRIGNDMRSDIEEVEPLLLSIEVAHAEAKAMMDAMAPSSRAA